MSNSPSYKCTSIATSTPVPVYENEVDLSSLLTALARSAGKIADRARFPSQQIRVVDPLLPCRADSYPELIASRSVQLLEATKVRDLNPSLFCF